MTDVVTIPELLTERARTLGNVTAIVSDDDAIGFDELDVRTFDRARRFVAAGMTRGTRVGLLAPNGIDWAVTALAVMRIGAVLVPLSTLLKPPELEAQLAVSAVAVLIATEEHRGRRYLDELDAHRRGLVSMGTRTARHPALPNLRRVWRCDALPEAPAPEALVAALEAGVRPAHDLAVIFTSGSRGAPKGVIHTHGNAIRATAAGLPVRCIGTGDRLYIPMPFFWMGGFGSGLLSMLVGGATLLTETDPTPASTIRFLERERATLFRGWPDQAAKIAAEPSFASADLRALRAGSLDPVLPPELRARPGARANLFGMTETFGPYCGSQLDTDLPAAAEGSCGRPFGAIEVRIVDADAPALRDGRDGRDAVGVDDAPLAAGESGEIEVRGPNVMRGICGRLRSEVFTRDGWYPTGDLGRLDDAGYLFSEGRADDMFKVSGATVFPTEVEAGLRAVPFVRQAYVTDLADAEGRSTVAALVIVTDEQPVGIAEVAIEAKARLSAYKIPKRWVLSTAIDAAPVTATGKVDRDALRRLLRERGGEAAP